MAAWASGCLARLPLHGSCRPADAELHASEYVVNVAVTVDVSVNVDVSLAVSLDGDGDVNLAVAGRPSGGS